MYFGKVGVMALVLLAVAACSSSGTLKVTQQRSGAIGANKTVALNLTNGPKVESTEIISSMRSRLFGRLVADRIFVKVVHGNEPADYKLDITVTEAEAVSGMARVMFGVLAGANTLNCDVKLIDSTTNKIVTAFKASGESASHPMSSENGREDAVRETVSNIILGLR